MDMIQPRNFGYGEEQEMIKDAARRFMEDKAPLSFLQTQIVGTEDPYHGKDRTVNYDKSAWQEMIDLGWQSLAVPEAQGGSGMNLVTAVALAEEVGRAAMPGPLTMTLQSTFVLREAASEGANLLLAAIALGASVTLAITGRDGSLEADSTDVTVNGTTLNGTACFVQDAGKADYFIVAASSESGIGLYSVASNSDGITISPDRIVDLTRDQARVSFTAVSAELISAAGEGDDVLVNALPALLTLVAADIAGAAEWQLQTTVEYAKVRVQFERPIGFFQAVKHPIVNMMIEVDQTRSLVYNAACAYDTDPEDAHRCAYLAKSSASDTAAFCSNRATQLHGGIGFTWEADMQIYFKRQKHSQFLFGDGSWQREKLAALL
jgi:alkylation response protein AidB-like acyl-CoA dehydrogenase